MTLTDMTYNDLLEQIQKLENAGLLDPNDKIALSIGQGKATKTLVGVKIETYGQVVLVASGNENAGKPRPVKTKASKSEAA